MSDGNRSGVNCMREKSADMEEEIARASVVLPTPGMSVNRTCPPARSEIRQRSTTLSLPTITPRMDSRIQFTPDLLPSDITGTSVYDPREALFKWLAGPVFAPVLLADEINRATPRTQSALLEAMAEGQVTVEGETRELPEPFFVVATQNPHQFHGTYPLPEGQLDRFMVATTMGYPERRAELGIVRAQVEGRPLEEIRPVVTASEVAEAREVVRKVQVHDEVLAYAVGIVEATRAHPAVSLGVSPRGTIALVRAAQARAATRGRDFVGPEDVKELAPDALPHRISVRGGSSGANAEAVVAEALKSVPSPA